MTNKKAIRPIVLPAGLDKAWEANQVPLRESAWLQVVEQGGDDVAEYFQSNLGSVHETILTNIIDAHISHNTVSEALEEMRDYISEYSHQLRYDTPDFTS